MANPFQIGDYRPIYLWAGPGTIRMNKIKFMGYPVDEEVHRAAHTLPVAARVVETLYTNWVHLMYDWGFPPEVEAEDWEDFRIAASAYHQAGTPVFAYIQTSNCVFQGSFTHKDWYALDPRGRKIYYYSGRYMVDWTHPEWIGHLKELIQGALNRGADGIFFDNMWYGEGPNNLLGAWVGGAGCYCDRCRNLYREETGQDLPKKILPDSADVAAYLRWRAGRVTATVRELAGFARELKPGCPISANDYDVTMRNSYLIYGIDVEALSDIQDVIMVENFALPCWEVSPKARLANNALTIRNTRAFVQDRAHLSVLSYDVGIGFDLVYPPRRHQQGIAEAAAGGASMTIKGTEYNDGERMTLLTDPAYQAQQEAIGYYNRWLAERRSIFQDRRNLAQVGLLHPGESLWRHWVSLAPVFYGAGQALTRVGIPWRVVREGDEFQDLTVLLTFAPGDRQQEVEINAPFHIHVPALPGWSWRKPGLAARGGLWHNLAEAFGLSMLRAYHASKLARRAMDRLNMAKLVTQTALFDLPPSENINALLDVLPDNLTPRVDSAAPVLIEVWQKGRQRQVHLMNYGGEAQQVTVHFGAPVQVEVLSPDFSQKQALKGEPLVIDLDIYCILIYE